MKTLTLENYRGFVGKHEIEFPDSNIVAIIGVNGAGKTTVLDALALALMHAANRLFGNPYKDQDILKVVNSDILNGVKTLGISCQVQFTLPIQLALDIELKRAMNGKTKAVFEHKYRHPSYDEDVLPNHLPILIYYGTGRRTVSRNSDPHLFKTNQKFARTKAYKDSLNSSIDFDQITSWYVQQVNIENSEKVARSDLNYEIKSISTATRAFNCFLRNLLDSQLSTARIEVSQFHKNQVLKFIKPTGDLEFEQLSAGEKIVVGMVLDIIYRMILANPDIEDTLQTPGIVLIDEVELHLHPKWQSSILQALSATFPNVQFIVTTHSPTVLNHLNSEQLLVLNDFTISAGKYLPNTYGMDTNTVIETVLGASSRPYEVTQLIADIESTLDKEEDNSRIEKAKVLIAKLKTIIDHNDTELLQIENLITLEEDEADYEG